MKAIKCDKCGSYYDQENSSNLSVVSGNQKLDLCNKCQKKLEAFMREKKHHRQTWSDEAKAAASKRMKGYWGEGKIKPKKGKTWKSQIVNQKDNDYMAKARKELDE